MGRGLEFFDTVDPANDDSFTICRSVLFYVLQLLATFCELDLGGNGIINCQNLGIVGQKYCMLWNIGYVVCLVVLCCDFFLVIYVIYEVCSEPYSKAQKHIFLCTKASFFFGFVKDIAVSTAKYFLVKDNIGLKMRMQSACQVTCAVSIAHFALFIMQSWGKCDKFWFSSLAWFNLLCVITGFIALCVTICIASSI